MVNLEVINHLWLQIDKVHLSYLQTEESLQRIEQKKKLEGYMKEYLCLVASNQRFYFSTTKDVLYTSILRRNVPTTNFSLTKFCHAWEMLGSYAANLIGQPWRKEFKEIRLYSGAYKYQIAQQLVGAEEILRQMGYSLDEEFDRLVVQGMLDYDRIVLVSRDCLLAKVESQILAEIHTALSVSLRMCSWADIFEYRDQYVGTVSHCVRGLMYQYHQKKSLAYQYGVPTSSAYLAPHEVYPTGVPYQIPLYQPMHQPVPYGMYLPMTLPVDEPDSKNQFLDLKYFEEPAKKLESPISVWNAANAGEVLKSIPKFDYSFDIDQLEQLCYEDLEPKMILPDGARAKKLNEKKEKPVAILPVSPAPVQNTTMSLNRESLSMKPSSVGRNSPELFISDASNKFQHRPTVVGPSKAFREHIQIRGWECFSCTYVNEEKSDICDMCAKSRHPGSESRPLFRGGRQCSQCTLVNPPEEVKCQACSTSLNHAPTYI